MRTYRAIGLMSGTSMDGVDVALIETDGETVSRFGPSALQVYREDEVALLRRAVEAARGITDRTARPGVIGEAVVSTSAIRSGLDPGKAYTSLMSLSCFSSTSGVSW